MYALDYYLLIDPLLIFFKKKPTQFKIQKSTYLHWKIQEIQLFASGSDYQDN